jgi:DHA1 family bicyclomycin/chloramphenicol resistance-like MFS transporter
MARTIRGSVKKSQAHNTQAAWIARLLIPFSWIGIDIYVPAITEVGQAFGAPVPLSISLYTLGLGIGQLLFGPLSDSFGRKPIAILGMVLFSLFSFLSLFTQNLEVFLVLRALQGIAASAAFVCADAVIRDCFSGRSAIREYGFLQATSNVFPVIAIPFGTLLLTQYGWRACFIFLGFSGLLMAGYLVYRMSETVSHHSRKPSTNSVNPWKNLPFLGFVACCCAVFSIIMSYVTIAPYELMTRLGLSQWNYGLATSCNPLIMGISAIIFSKIAGYKGGIFALWLALFFLIVGSIGLVLSREWLDAWSFIVPVMFISIGFGGFIGPASSLAMQPFSDNKGKAAAILGAGQLLGAALVTALLSYFELMSRLSLGLVAVFFTGLSALICLGLIRRFGTEYLQNPLELVVPQYQRQDNEVLVGDNAGGA